MLEVLAARSILQFHASCSLENHIFSFRYFFFLASLSWPAKLEGRTDYADGEGNMFLVSYT